LKISGCVCPEHKKPSFGMFFILIQQKRLLTNKMSTVVHAASLGRHHQIMKTNRQNYIITLVRLVKLGR
jgi:hypothetical protein